MSQQKYKLIIAVYGCVTLDRYVNEIKMINQTWGKLANQNTDIKLIFFLGQDRNTEFQGQQYIYLNDVGNDYLSASYKQFMGLKYIYDNYNTEFIICCGTDTYLNIPKLIKFLEKFNPSDNLYIGGHGDERTIYGKSYYFHAGGPGFIITEFCLQQLYPLLDNLMNDWKTVCDENKNDHLYPACDVAIAYYLQKDIDVNVVKTNDLSFLSCNYLGYPCRHQEAIKMKNIISCHHMTMKDFILFTEILRVNNYFFE